MAETLTTANNPAAQPTEVRFESKFFGAVEGMYFRLSGQTGEAVMIVKLGDNEVALTLPGIIKEFRIEPDSADGRMLEVVRKGLGYVKGLRIGDAIPKEILTREASWDPSERHKQISYQRLTMQLVSWLTGEEHVITNPDQLLQIAGDPQVRRKVNKAFDEAAVKLGYGKDREKVIDNITSLSREFAYIEALRDVFLEMQAMEDKIQALRRLYGADRGVLENAQQVARLGERALADFQARFTEIDDQTSEILAVLKNIDNQIAFVREQRDEMHRRMMAWEEILADWSKAVVRTSEENEKLLRKTYQFLAPRYMLVNEWVLVGRRPTQLESEKKAPVMRWY